MQKTRIIALEVGSDFVASSVQRHFAIYTFRPIFALGTASYVFKRIFHTAAIISRKKSGSKCAVKKIRSLLKKGGKTVTSAFAYYAYEKQTTNAENSYKEMHNFNEKNKKYLTYGKNL